MDIALPSNFGAHGLDDNGLGIFDTEFVEHLGALAHITLAVAVIFRAFLEGDVIRVSGRNEIIEVG